MMGVKERHYSPLPREISLEDLVPEDNFYRLLEERLDLSFVRDLVRPLYAKGGRPSVDPVVFFANAGYQWNIRRNVNTQIGDNFVSRVDPGDAVAPKGKPDRSRTTVPNPASFARSATSSPTRRAASVFVPPPLKSGSTDDAATIVWPRSSSMTWA
jgi:hypothetical protein